ncbi:uncharacterized protein LOC100678587 [Nasonia vitripennis]|uniref:Uncharacterized protein n=1 Tax=Nasonia vitripennis TaxID=7425 RepID=A0A7M7GF44_NASVI|nr:uncharacterized protein LOC100678587 [Nasonia vitripennis]
MPACRYTQGSEQVFGFVRCRAVRLRCLKTDIQLGQRCGFTTPKELVSIKKDPKGSPIVRSFYADQLSDVLDCVLKRFHSHAIMLCCHSPIHTSKVFILWYIL